MQLKLRGKPLVLHPAPPSAEIVKRHLDRLPEGELMFVADLAAATGVAESTILNLPMRTFEGYRLRVGRYCYWGSRKSIAELRRQVVR